MTSVRLTHRIVATIAVSAVAVGLAGASALAIAQTSGTPERFTALAVNMSNVGRSGAETVEIVVNRWSTDAERDKLMTTLLEKGPDKLLDTLQSLPRVGYFRTPTSLGYDIHYARRHPLPDGGERVVLVTDRRIGFWEAVNQPRSIDYPFTLIELHLNANGEGEGKLSVATKITADPENKVVVLENYATQPVLLTSVKREKTSH
jgi:hypothetical protein